MKKLRHSLDRPSRSDFVQSEFMEDKVDEQQKDNYRSHYRNNRSNTLERCFYKSVAIPHIQTPPQTTIEQNRCAMACQGCGAVLFLLKKQWNYFP